MVNCVVCQKVLLGGIDTFGSYDMPMCWEHFSELNGQGGSCYGLAPHVHDLSRTGSIIGSTVFTGEEDSRFVADLDAPGLGVWIWSTARGWR